MGGVSTTGSSPAVSVSVEGAALVTRVPDASCFKYIAATNAKALVGGSICVQSPFVVIPFGNDRSAFNRAEHAVILARPGAQI
jgi:hypothetical protein